jgi:hypothetical protein
MSSPTDAEITCSTLLDVMLMHTTLNGGALESIQRHHFLEYLLSTNLNILNKGNEPTFVVSNRHGVIDSTLGIAKRGNLAFNWHVSDDTSLSP